MIKPVIEHTQNDDNFDRKPTSSCAVDIVLSTGVRTDNSYTSPQGVPLPLLFASSVAAENGLNIKILNLYRRNDTIDTFTSLVSQYETPLWGLTCYVTDRFEMFTGAQIVKKLRPATLVVVGGIFASQCYKQIMEDLPFVDVVVRGEGEYALYELFLATQGRMNFKDIQGTSWRSDGKIIHNSPRPMIKDLNTLPQPRYDLLKLSDYMNLPSRYFSSKFLQEIYGTGDVKVADLMFSRGCPFDCIFCCSKKHYFGKFRIIRPERAVEQIEWFYAKGYRLFTFLDDHLLLNRKWFNAFYELILQKGLKFMFKMSARVDSVTEEIAEKLSAISCKKICLGIEYGDDRVLKEIGKNITTADIERTVKILCKNGIEPYAGMIINFPCETEASIDKSVRFFKNLEQWWSPQNIFPHPVEVYPGTVMESEYWLKQYPQFRWTENYFNKDNLIYKATSPFVPIWQNWHWTKEFYLLLKAALKAEKQDIANSILERVFLHLDTKCLTRKDRFVIKMLGTVIIVFILLRKPGYLSQILLTLKNNQVKKRKTGVFQRCRRKLTGMLYKLL